VSRIAGVLLVVCGVAEYAAGAAGAQPGDPVVAGAPDGGYAVAVPGFLGDPALAGGAVAFAVQDPDRERLFRVAAASATGWWTLYEPHRRR
jgi:hypothetical protein